MADEQFTPGPWSVERIDCEKYGLDASFEVNAGFRTVVQTHMRKIKSEGDALATDEANCHLIASAPALYEALDELVAQLNGDGMVVSSTVMAAQTALRQARGESQ